MTAVLFDLDGTLLDSVDAIIRATKEALVQMGLPYDEGLIRDAIGIPLVTQAGQFAPGREEEFLETYKPTYRKYNRDVLYHGALDCLESLHTSDVKLGLVTSKEQRPTYRVIDATGMTGKFDVVVSANDVHHPKPHPEPILKAIETLDLTRDEVSYVGDSYFDIECAKRAGVPVVCVTWGARSRKDLALMSPDAIVDSYDELLEWISRR